MRIHIGIDPGKLGACAIMGDGMSMPAVTPMPLAGKVIDWSAMGEWVNERITDAQTNTLRKRDLSMSELTDVSLWCTATIEKAHAMPGQGVTSMFSFGETYGGWFGLMGALGIPLRIVTPQAWKRAILAGTSKDKAAAIAYVRRAYPGVNLLATERSRTAHDGMADAVCIAEYGMRMERGR